MRLRPCRQRRDSEQEKRRSQNGYVFILNGMPVMFCSKVTSVAFANERIGEAHADMSSGASEIYCTGNATLDLLFESYIADEMGVKLPETAKLQMDNNTAEAFSNNTAKNSKLKHIDCRQWWVRMLRDKSIIRPVHCPIPR